MPHSCPDDHQAGLRADVDRDSSRRVALRWTSVTTSRSTSPGRTRSEVELASSRRTAAQVVDEVLEDERSSPPAASAGSAGRSSTATSTAGELVGAARRPARRRGRGRGRPGSPAAPSGAYGVDGARNLARRPRAAGADDAPVAGRPPAPAGRSADAVDDRAGAERRSTDRSASGDELRAATPSTSLQTDRAEDRSGSSGRSKSAGCSSLKTAVPGAAGGRHAMSRQLPVAERGPGRPSPSGRAAGSR